MTLVLTSNSCLIGDVVRVVLRQTDQGSNLSGDSYILIFFLLPDDQPCVSFHCCLDACSLSADKLSSDEKFGFVRILELYF